MLAPSPCAPGPEPWSVQDLTTTMRGNFDFFYCPWDHKATAGRAETPGRGGGDLLHRCTAARCRELARLGTTSDMP